MENKHLILNERMLDILQEAVDLDAAVQNYLDELNDDNELPLQEFCKMGGMPDQGDDAVLALKTVAINGKLVEGVFTASFDEVVYGGGCPDIAKNFPRQGDVRFTIDLSTGKVNFEAIKESR